MVDPPIRDFVAQRTSCLLTARSRGGVCGSLLGTGGRRDDGETRTGSHVRVWNTIELEAEIPVLLSRDAFEDPLTSILAKLYIVRRCWTQRMHELQSENRSRQRSLCGRVPRRRRDAW